MRFLKYIFYIFTNKKEMMKIIKKKLNALNAWSHSGLCPFYCCTSMHLERALKLSPQELKLLAEPEVVLVLVVVIVPSFLGL